MFREGNIQDARILWDKMTQKSLAPDIVSYNALIGGLCINEKMQEVEVTLD